MDELIKEGLENKQKKLTPIEISGIVFSVVFFLIFCYILHTSPNAFNYFFNTVPNTIINNIYYIFRNLSIFFQTLSNDRELKISYLKYGVLYAIIIALTIIYLLNAKDNELYIDTAIFKNPTIYFTIGIIIPLILLFFFVLPYLRGGSIDRNVTIGGLVFFGFAMLLFFLYTNLTTTQLKYLTWVLSILFLLISVTALAIIFYIFGNYLKTLTGWAGFFVYFLFYIPCLLIDFIEYIKAEFKATPNTVYILFIIEILLILIYNYAPYIINKTINSTGKILLKKNVYLDKEYTLAVGEDFKVKKTKAEEDENLTTFNQNYSVSMWTYLNAQPKNFKAYSSETNIFDYGNGKPKITYNYDLSNNYKNNKYRIYFTDEDNKKVNNYYEFTMPDQKWNNIVVNYTSTTVDLFINGKIEKTFYFKDKFVPPRYFSDDIIKVGENNGLYGSICNVKYFFRPQTKYEIANNYNLLMLSNPPIYMEE
jgi:hypothetical protein